MPMPPYPLFCYRPGCERPAVYKIAARWSDGVTEELKTYALCCEVCLPESFRQSRQRQAACRLAKGEILEPPGIFRLEHGQRDRRLQRLPELEETVRSEGEPGGVSPRWQHPPGANAPGSP